MGFMDAINAEDRVEIKISDLYRFMQQAADANAKLHYIQNSIDANVPNHFIRSMFDAEKHEPELPARNYIFAIGPIIGKEEPEDDV